MTRLSWCTTLIRFHVANVKGTSAFVIALVTDSWRWPDLSSLIHSKPSNEEIVEVVLMARSFIPSQYLLSPLFHIDRLLPEVETR
jgi:hypothetical protein